MICQNVILMTFPAMIDSTEETDERRFASGASTEQPLAERPESFRVGKLWVFCAMCRKHIFLANCESANCWQQIWCRQIVSFHFSANRYAPIKCHTFQVYWEFKVFFCIHSYLSLAFYISISLCQAFAIILRNI